MLKFKFLPGEDGRTFSQEIPGIPLFSSDENDPNAFYLICTEGDARIACARLFSESEGSFRIDRIFVQEAYRHAYIGDTLLRVLEDRTVSQKGYLIKIRPTDESHAFFLREGYLPNGTDMLKDLTKPIHACTACRAK